MRFGEEENHTFRTIDKEEKDVPIKEWSEKKDTGRDTKFYRQLK